MQAANTATEHWQHRATAHGRKNSKQGRPWWLLQGVLAKCPEELAKQRCAAYLIINPANEGCHSGGSDGFLYLTQRLMNVQRIICGAEYVLTFSLWHQQMFLSLFQTGGLCRAPLRSAGGHALQVSGWLCSTVPKSF